MADRGKPTTEPDAIGLDATSAAKLLGISRSHFWNLHSKGLLPAPKSLGQRKVWLRDELIEFLRAGAPAREKWEQMQKGARR